MAHSTRFAVLAVAALLLALLPERHAAPAAADLCALSGLPPKKPVVPPHRCPAAAELSCCADCADTNRALQLVSSTLDDVAQRIDPNIPCSGIIDLTPMVRGFPRVPLLRGGSGAAAVPHLRVLGCNPPSLPPPSSPSPPLPTSPPISSSLPRSTHPALSHPPLSPHSALSSASRQVCDAFQPYPQCMLMIEKIICGATCNPGECCFIASRLMRYSGTYVVKKGGEISMTVCQEFANAAYKACKDIEIQGVAMNQLIPDVQNMMVYVTNYYANFMGIENFSIAIGTRPCLMGAAAAPTYTPCCDPLAVDPKSAAPAPSLISPGAPAPAVIAPGAPAPAPPAPTAGVPGAPSPPASPSPTPASPSFPPPPPKAGAGSAASVMSLVALAVGAAVFV
ncbi:unnamed protein product [Closterium sp. NIES-64]|nr:unnamed protein product [Closterium sp. NIES-64]